MGSKELKEFDAELQESQSDNNVGRLEIHVKRFLSVNANAPHHSTGVSYFKCEMDDRTKRMLEARIPKRYFGAILPSMRNVAFYVHAAKPNNGVRRWVLVIGSETMSGFTKYDDGHAMLIFTVTKQEYRELKAWLDPSKVASGYDVEFDFEPLTNPRDYRCGGGRNAGSKESRLAHLMGGH